MLEVRSHLKICHFYQLEIKKNKKTKQKSLTESRKAMATTKIPNAIWTFILMQAFLFFTKITKFYLSNEGMKSCEPETKS